MGGGSGSMPPPFLTMALGGGTSFILQPLYSRRTIRQCPSCGPWGVSGHCAVNSLVQLRIELYAVTLRVELSRLWIRDKREQCWIRHMKQGYKWTTRKDGFVESVSETCLSVCHYGTLHSEVDLYSSYTTKIECKYVWGCEVGRGSAPSYMETRKRKEGYNFVNCVIAWDTKPT
jgi:hypothetical protein